MVILLNNLPQRVLDIGYRKHANDAGAQVVGLFLDFRVYLAFCEVQDVVKKLWPEDFNTCFRRAFRDKAEQFDGATDYLWLVLHSSEQDSTQLYQLFGAIYRDITLEVFV